MDYRTFKTDCFDLLNCFYFTEIVTQIPPLRNWTYFQEIKPCNFCWRWQCPSTSFASHPWTLHRAVQFCLKLSLNKLSLHKHRYIFTAHPFSRTPFVQRAAATLNRSYNLSYGKWYEVLSPQFLYIFIGLQNLLFLACDRDLQLVMHDRLQWQNNTILSKYFAMYWQPPWQINLLQSILF